MPITCGWAFAGPATALRWCEAFVTVPARLVELFEDEPLRRKIQRKLPHLFQIAESESRRAGKIGMEVGSVRERILVGLLIYKFGEENVDTGIPITEPEVDVRLFGEPVSMKTITGMGGVKVVWTVDAQSAFHFYNDYTPRCHMLLARIAWNSTGGLFLIPLSAQERVFRNLGRDGFLTLPKAGTNPRGVEFSRQALSALLEDKDTKCIEIVWERSEIDYNPYRRWVDYWQDD